MAFHRRRQLSSNVRPHRNQCWRTTRQNSLRGNPKLCSLPGLSLKRSPKREGLIDDFSASDYLPKSRRLRSIQSCQLCNAVA
ncbi:hypothetical protein RA210_U280002 [Rubrivivax sp. A210]|nr:hypothetical protein RA210_U280002 [Rubrivivax sp. A210]